MLKSIFTLGAVAMLAIAFLPSPENQVQAGQRLSLTSVQSGRYVRAGVGPDTKLAAVSTRAVPNGWEAFEWVTFPNSNEFALRSILNGKFISVGQDGYLRANVAVPPNGRLGPRKDIRFEYIQVQGGFAMRSVANGRFVRAGIGQYSLMGAVSNRPAGWETFRCQPLP